MTAKRTPCFVQINSLEQTIVPNIKCNNNHIFFLIDNYASIINIIIIISFICYIPSGPGMVCTVTPKVVMILNSATKTSEIKLKKTILKCTFKIAMKIFNDAIKPRTITQVTSCDVD